MANAEHNRLENNCPSGATCYRLKLLLKITTKCGFLTKSCGESNRYPCDALKNSSGKKSLRGICSTAQDVRIHQANPQRPQACAYHDVFHRLSRCSPSAANKIAQTYSALVHAHADIEHQQPFKDHYRNIAWHRAAAPHRCLRLLLYGVLKEATNDGQPHK